MSPQRSHFQSLDRQLEVVHRARRGSEVVDVVDLARNEEILGDVVLDEIVVRIASEMIDVRRRTGDQVVDGNDLVAIRQQSIRQV